MINVGLLVGGIFGLITAVGADMVGGKIGLGNRIAYYSSLRENGNLFCCCYDGFGYWNIYLADCSESRLKSSGQELA